MIPGHRNGAPAAPSARHFGRMIGGLHQQLGGAGAQTASVELLARLAWQAMRAGHVALPLDALPDAAADAARSSPVVARDGGVAPLSLDRGHLYLRRYLAAERRLASALRARAGDQALVDVAAAESMLDAAFGVAGDQTRVGQRRAAAVALNRRLLVLTGGPGTGKTFTLARIASLLGRARRELRVAVAAPTGRAAARAAEAIGTPAAPGLAVSGMSTGRADPMALLEDPRAHPEPMPWFGTLHRLLGLGLGGEVARGRGPLPFDVVIVDEASMLDLVLASRLLERMAPDARLVLAGDKDQLAAVDAGAVFAELCDERAGLADNVVRLDHNFRFERAPGVARLAAALRTGEADEAVRIVTSGAHAELQWIDAAEHADDLPVRACAGFEALAAGVVERVDLTELLERLGRFRVLCTVRDGPFGAHAINARVAAWMRRRVSAATASSWYRGRVVLVTANDPGSGLSNGDVGICIADGDGSLVVAFERAGPPLLLDPSRIGRHEDGYAMTVHKAQGSEFDSVLLLLPGRDSPLAVRELVYTGATRARERLIMAGELEALRAAAATPTRRHSALADRLGRAEPAALG